MQRIAAAAMMPSGVPPIPISRSVPESGRAAAIAPATSPSEISLIRAPVVADLRDQLVRGAAGPGCTPSDPIPTTVFALATLRMFSEMGAVMSMASAASGPTAILFM